MQDLKIQYNNVSGDQDQNSPHSVSLSGSYLKKGYQEVVIPSLLPRLNDGSFYDISISAKDLAGNQSDPFILSNILYDITKPIIQKLLPAPVEIKQEVISHSNSGFNSASCFPVITTESDENFDR